jgi:hypothetical protein
MFASLQDFLRRLYRGADRGRPANDAERPPTPPGWRIVPHATHGITAYEVSAIFSPRRQGEAGNRGSGIGTPDMVGLNSAEFHGFAPETLEIGRVDLRVIIDGPERGSIRLTYRFDHDPRGRRKGSLIPAFDYHRLPLHPIEGEPADCSATTDEATAHG